MMGLYVWYSCLILNGLDYSGSNCAVVVKIRSVIMGAGDMNDLATS